MNLLRHYIRELLTEAAFGLPELKARGLGFSIEDNVIHLR